MELNNTENECTIGVFDTEDDELDYRPVIMWNLCINSYLSEKDLSYRAYGCVVKVKGKQGQVKSFNIFIKESDFGRFDRVRKSIVDQTFGELILNSRFDFSLWSDLVPKLLIDCSDNIRHQQPARNIGLQWHYLKSKAFEHGGVLQMEHVEIVYKDVVYNGLGEIMKNNVNILVPEAFPNKTFRVSEFKPSGLRGFLKNCLPPYTATSKFRREQQILTIIGALGQHFYRLIVHNTGSCPSLMLASYEPETQKSTAALVGLKAVSDPKQFFNLQSSAAAVLEQRSTSSLPTVFDDVEGDSGQNKMMVGSMNAASKFTKGEGEEEQLGGTVYTKNLKDGMKMPAKIIEGRNNWLLMEKDATYEEEDMGENCESNFEHCNEMSNILMPRGFLAKLTRYFIRSENEHISFFQEAQREACEVMASRRPHWRKRKSKSAALFISMFFLVEKEVAECEDSISKELFVEAFSSRDYFIDFLMKALDRVDEVEASMSDGVSMKMPSWVYGDGVEEDQEVTSAILAMTKDPTFDINKLVGDTLDIIEGLSSVDKTKYVKVFHHNEATVGIQHTKVKSLAKEKGLATPKFLTQKKNYPGFVTLKTETFTKMSASSSHGTVNTGPGFCTSIILHKLSPEIRLRIAEEFDLPIDELLIAEETVEEDEDVDIDPAASQDYPEFSQSQNSDTLKVCEICNFKTRSKLDFNKHTDDHPKCQVCKKICKDDNALTIHIVVHQTTECSECGISVSVSSLREHTASHELTEIYKTGLNKPKSKGKDKKVKEPKSDQPAKLNSYLVFCRVYRESKKQTFPTLNMMGINEKLREHWHSLTPAEKAAYKSTSTNADSTATSLTATNPIVPSASTSAESPTTGNATQPHIASHIPASFQPPANQPSSVLQRGQTTILKCDDCGRMFFTNETMEAHRTAEHGTAPFVLDTPSNAARREREELDSSDPEQALQWYRFKSKVLWPSKMTNSMVPGQEVTLITMYDDKSTEIEVEIAKLKPFKPLERIPRTRTAEWRRAYEKALLEYS